MQTSKKMDIKRGKKGRKENTPAFMYADDIMLLSREKKVSELILLLKKYFHKKKMLLSAEKIKLHERKKYINIQEV